MNPESKHSRPGSYETTLNRYEKYFGTKLWPVFLVYSRYISGDEDNLKMLIDITGYHINLLNAAIQSLSPKNRQPLVQNIKEILEQPDKLEILRKTAQNLDLKR